MEYISVTEALSLTEEIGTIRPCRSTIVNWCSRYGLGYLVGGKWVIKKEEFINFIKGEKSEKEKNKKK